MSAGNKPNNTVVIDGQNFQDLFNISPTYTANLDVMILQGNKGVRVFGTWDSATAFSSAAKAACINFGKGSMIIDIQAKILWVKTAAAGTDTWAYSATMT